jgi:hypothetical protein
MILREVKPPSPCRSTADLQVVFIQWFPKKVQDLRKEIGLTTTFTLDACRHGGMDELEKAELTDGQGRALSGHKTRQAHAGYAKQSLERALPATRKRHAHRLANAQRTNVQNEGRNPVQNGPEENNSGTA